MAEKGSLEWMMDVLVDAFLDIELRDELAAMFVREGGRVKPPTSPKAATVHDLPLFADPNICGRCGRPPDPRLPWNLHECKA